MKQLLILLFLLTGTLAAEEVNFSIDADTLSYDRENQSLTGQGIVITFKEGSKLFASHAEVDAEGKKGVVSRSQNEEPVVFTGLIDDEEGVKRPLIVKADQMGVETLKEGESARLAISAFGHVQIFFDEEYTAEGSDASFLTGEGELEGNFSFPRGGTILLHGGESKARVEKKNGDFILADELQIDTKTRLVKASSFEAEFFLPEQMQAVKIQAGYGVWDPSSSSLKLSDQVSVLLAGLLSLDVNGELIMEPLNDEFLTKGRVKTKGETTLSALKERRRLKCFGTLDFDALTDHLTLTTPSSSKGAPSLQARFVDEYVALFANTIEIDLKREGEHLEAKQLLFDGKVRASLRMVPDERVSTFLEQYAFASRMEYLVDEGKMRCYGDEEQKVLYHNPNRGIQMSAPELVVTGLLNNQFEAKGVGNVRLRLNPIEVERIEEMVPLLRSWRYN